MKKVVCFSSLLAFMCMGKMSSTDHYQLKTEIDPVLSNMANESMMKAHEENVAAGSLEYLKADGGHTSVREADGATMAMHAEDGRIIAVEHKRLSDPEAKSSQGLEALCFLALLSHVRVILYATVIIDGCRELVCTTWNHHVYPPRVTTMCTHRV